MVRIRPMVAAGLLVSVLGFAACGGNKSSGKTGDASAGGADGSRGGAGGSGAGGTGAGGTAAGGTGAGGAGVGGTGTAGAGGGTAGAGGTATTPITCEGITNPQCSDGLDNDMDGKTDSLDLECVGPCDNAESSFATGIPGDNVDACKQDCFFDGNSGQGDDGCNWNLKCDSANPGAATGCPYVAGSMGCKVEQDPKCIRNCQKLAPNGCDCFGCCAVNAGGTAVSVMLVATCTADKFGDATACPRCTQNPSCVNTCEKCEVCLGRPAPDPSCTPTTTDAGTPTTDASTPPADAGMTTQCSEGVATCSATTPCATGSYCQTGCCVRFTIE